MKAWRFGALAAGAVAIVATFGVPGSASAQATSGQEHFTLILRGNGAGGRVDATGVFNASGKDVENNPGAVTGTSTFTFKHGSIFVSHTDDPGGTQNFDPATCVATFHNTGDFTLTGGTGVYEGISGHGEFRVNGRLGFAHTKKGCGNDPISGNTIVQADGPVSLA
jgi:hypothetical protein